MYRPSLSPNTGSTSASQEQEPAYYGILQNLLSKSPTKSQQKKSSLEDIIDEELRDDGEHERQEISPDETYQNIHTGQWGEGPSNVNVVDAEHDFRRLECTLTRESRHSGLGTTGKAGIVRRKSSIPPQQQQQAELPQKEAGGQEIPFDYEALLKEDILPGFAEKGIKIWTMGVCWKQLSVIGEGVENRYIATTGDPFVAFFNFINPLFWTILYPMDGCCEGGEMVLVLGRPGAGCSTLLRVLANDRKNYKKVLGEVSFNNLSADIVAKHYKGEVLYNQEDDFHYPSLTVNQTLDTALKARTPRARLPDITGRKDFREKFLDVLTKMYGLTRQRDTLVGNAFIRGISGGERKRLSIAEQMATRSSINMWDGSTRGLDASSALDYVKSLRIQTNLFRQATLVSIYQASDSIYRLFDKVLVLYKGRCIYFGPAKDARQYFISMGFYCPERQTTAEFLTAVTDRHERKPMPGLDPTAASNLPSTPEQFEQLYKQSVYYDQAIKQLTEYEARLSDEGANESFRETARLEKQKHVSIKNPYTITYWNQIWAMVIRQIYLVRGNIGSLVSRYISMIVLAIMVGTCFLLLPTTSTGAFTRGGLIYFSVLFNALVAEEELTTVIDGRPILYKLKKYAMYRPSALCIAQAIVDIPINVIHTLIYSCIVYFMAGLQRTAGKFFIFVLALTLATLCMTAFFRLCGCASRTFDGANTYASVIVLGCILFSGYLIPYQSLHPWFVWLFWINPLAYAFKALMANEMSGLRFTCDAPYLIPHGPGYDSTANQVCTIAGSKPQQNYVDGPDYLYGAYRYKTSEMWINIVAVALFWILFTVAAAWVMDTKEYGKGGFSTNVFKKPKKGKLPRGSVRGASIHPAPDVEQGLGSQPYQAASSADETHLDTTERAPSGGDIAKGSVFSWENMDYVVPNRADPSGKKQLLCNITGYVKPGTMTALMGSSGAGKTTLLDVLAQRKTIGTVTGHIEVDGQPLRRDFQRTTGYCEQLNVHVPESTVREALRFSAYLRQQAEVSKADKEAYVEKILQILEMEDIADAMIGSTESGLGISVEERKRLSIGIELVAKPKLLFLDEPTSGLDAQAAFSIMRFMRKLTDQGQAILCTIHQPSAQLFEFFDDILLLAKGGRTVYFGEIGQDSSSIINYFEKNGAPRCTEDANPAEYILDVINLRSSMDWPVLWDRSPEKQKLLGDIQAIRQALESNGPNIADTNPSQEREYAASMGTQFKYVFKRMAKTYWRLPEYNLARLEMMAVFGLLNGFAFFRLGHSLVDLQLRVFVVFQILVLSPILVNAVQYRFHAERQWYIRDKASKYYGWFPFSASIILIELPWVLLTSTVFFCTLYWTTGFTTDPISTLYTYLTTVIYTVFSVTLAQWIVAWTPDIHTAFFLDPFVLSALSLFCGVSMPYESMPKFWRSWIYWLDPNRYTVEGLVTSQLYNLKVECADSEYNVFQPPSGQACGEYAASFLQQAPGYLNNPNDTSNCRYCQYSKGQDFYKGLNMDISYRWRDLGISCLFLATNVLLIMLGVRFSRTNKR
ncbi:ABC-2 type transporter-domain-containing protein [Lobosporangium transversale]|uniref:ABC-2 type transporter-domain-containing protein n=1 Tax=Lobosporangium transversale TaxID=64571 RepID=A0A1Y2H2F7_9FUNG|nr:ABC-2 type transporter-domain-containing protein [Lobosporangium transversale]ORZ27232.1 ABC-2 type transporter-domain-containing protein [Lobosporangium transversale]|eukprot:XP_021884959.1 ABC-2 type transporter-domain-containing protein [Lobosporangium transversale]